MWCFYKLTLRNAMTHIDTETGVRGTYKTRCSYSWTGLLEHWTCIAGYCIERADVYIFVYDIT